MDNYHFDQIMQSFKNAGYNLSPSEIESLRRFDVSAKNMGGGLTSRQIALLAIDINYNEQKIKELEEKIFKLENFMLKLTSAIKED